MTSTAVSNGMGGLLNGRDDAREAIAERIDALAQAAEQVFAGPSDSHGEIAAAHGFKRIHDAAHPAKHRAAEPAHGEHRDQKGD